MTQEEKQLLLKDLCARLPYVTYYDLSYYGHKTRAILQEFIATKEPLKSLVKVNTIVGPIPYENIKPYLRPLSSMTEEERKEFMHIFDGPIIYDENSNLVTGFECNTFEQFVLLENWLNSHHFDYRGLIEKSLALEAPDDMYKNE